MWPIMACCENCFMGSLMPQLVLIIELSLLMLVDVLGVSYLFNVEI